MVAISFANETPVAAIQSPPLKFLLLQFISLLLHCWCIADFEAFNVFPVAIAKEARIIDAILLAQLRNRLWKIDVDSAVVNQCIVHLKICSLTFSLRFEFDECVAQRVVRFAVTYDFAAEDFAKARKYDLQIVGFGDWVQFADEENIVRRFDVCHRQITNHFEHFSPWSGFHFDLYPFGLFFRLFILFQVHVLSLLKSVLELVRDGQHGRVLRIGDGKARRIWERVIEDVRVTNANDLVGCSVLVYKGFVDFQHHVHALGHVPKERVVVVKGIQIRACGDQELRAVGVGKASVGHRHAAGRLVAKRGVEFIFKIACLITIK